MKLNLDHLKERHNYWKNEIGKVGIWNPDLFSDVEIKIRKNHRKYNALFQRRVFLREGMKVVKDKIVVYNRVEDFQPAFIDSVLVHEMIHQYIIQTNQKDSSTHGKLFKGFMNAINRTFKGTLEIKIKDSNPNELKSGPGDTVHKILTLHFLDGRSLYCVIMPGRETYFERMVKTNRKYWRLKSYDWRESNDVYFNRLTRCSKRLHGIYHLPEGVF